MGNALNVANIPKELSLLLELVKIENNKDILKRFNKKEIDWDLFLDLTWHHRLFPVLYPKLKKIEEQVPPFVLKTLQAKYQENTIHMLQLTATMINISHALRNNQIRTLFLKGPLLGLELYGDISLRTSSDLDFLVPLEDLGKVENLLISMGYVKDDYFQSVLGDWKWRHHHIAFFHQETNTKIEVHWRLNPGPGMEPCFNELWERKRTNLITNSPINLLGKEDLCFFLITHGARHGWSRLRWLLDIKHLLDQELNWSVLSKLLKKYHCLHLGGQAIILSSQLLGVSVKKEMESMIRGTRAQTLAQESIFYLERMVNLHTEPLPDDIARFHKKHLYSLQSFQQKTLYILSIMYPYPTDLETLPLPKNLHFLYFPLRPFLTVWRITKKSAYSRRAKE